MTDPCRRCRFIGSVWKARERGVLFDVGDGTTAFGFSAAETAIGEGFLPDTISSDFYSAHVESRTEHDLPLTASKLIAAGMTEEQVWPRITSSPARVLKLEDKIGCIHPETAADLTVLERGTQPAELRDGHGEVRTGFRWYASMTVKDGNLYGPSAHSQH